MRPGAPALGNVEHSPRRTLPADPEALAPAADRSFLGHPKGLFFLAFTETWERFSFYGVMALLVLYMVNRLLLPGQVEYVAGFAAFRGGLEFFTGPLTPLALASLTFGLYSGFALAFDRTFLVALLLLVIGSGFLKGNISAQVGALYRLGDEARRTRGFAIFQMGINFGAVFGPVLCGFLAQYYGWHYGFGASAIFMLAGLMTDLYGYRYPAGPGEATRAPRPRTDRGRLADHPCAACRDPDLGVPVDVSLNVGGFGIPVPWFQSIDSISSILAVPPLFWLWRRQAAGRSESVDMARIGMGAWIAAARRRGMKCLNDPHQPYREAESATPSQPRQASPDQLPSRNANAALSSSTPCAISTIGTMS